MAGSGINIFNEHSFDAAGRLRMSTPKIFGEYKILNNTFPTIILEQNGTATFTNNTNRVTMSVTSGQYGIITSKQYHPYFNGFSQLVEFTFAGMGSATNVEKSIGYISSNNSAPFNSSLDGFRIFKDTADAYSLEIWRNGSRTHNIARSSWLDKLDGTGPSGMTINWANFNVMFCDFLYLGGTRLCFYVIHNGEPQLFHQINYANTDTVPFLLSPNKQIRYEIRSTTGSGNMDFICAMIASEGAQDVNGTGTTIKGSIAGVSPMASGTTYALCGVRKSATFRDIFARVMSFEGAINSSNDYISVTLLLNPTVAGTFTYSAVTNTPFEAATGALTNTVTGGIPIGDTWSSLNMNNAKDVSHNILARLNSTLNDTMDSIVLCATPAMGSNNVKATGSMNVEWFNQ